VQFRSDSLLHMGISQGYQHWMTQELQLALKRDMQWFGSYNKHTPG